MNDTIAVETTTGDVLLVELNETARVLRFLDDNDALIRAYSFTAFADITGGLVLDQDASIIIDAVAVANLQQWARI